MPGGRKSISRTAAKPCSLAATLQNSLSLETELNINFRFIQTFCWLVRHFASLVGHFAELVRHFAGLVAHFAELVRHFAGLVGQFAESFRRFAGLVGHFAELVKHFHKAAANIRFCAIGA